MYKTFITCLKQFSNSSNKNRKNYIPTNSFLTFEKKIIISF